ncbi:thioredoxin [Paenibacillus antibioticophila]|uniref:thioredoxin n=1 Tax=Paenibacillus antibioticophila TaxID=1274374 RepID=UPI0005CA482B|nr:thioredoxin [Paenibacillus antibioticophila]
MSSLRKVDPAAFDTAVREKEVVLVDFGAEWCPPCKVLSPILEELQIEEGERLSILKVDCDESPELAGRFGVMSMPTVILFQNGEPIDKLVGLRSKDVYRAAYGRYMVK